MNALNGIKEVVESAKSKFADSPLGKKAESFEKDKTKNYDAPLGKDVKGCPENNGNWEGERGNSKWIPESDYVPQKCNRNEQKTWGEILNQYGIDGIVFKDGEPDFSSVSKGEVKIEGFSSNRSDNFDKADIELAKQKGCSPENVHKWCDDNGYTWHERRDIGIMQKVPSKIHSNISHRGGISRIKEIENNG